MDNPPSEEEQAKFAYKYDPAHARQPKRRLVWAAGLLILAVVVAIAAAMGILHWQPASPASVPTTKISADNVMIAGTYSETAVLLIGAGGTYEVKLATTTTNTVVVTDLTRGKSLALAAALSPLRDRVAVLQKENGHHTAVVIDLNGNSRPVNNDKLLIVPNAKVEPCSWSPIAWSPDGKRFSFFACGKINSVLVVVEAETELTPTIIKTTDANQSASRQVFWLTDNSLLYTFMDASTQYTKVRRVEVGTDSVPLGVYGD